MKVFVFIMSVYTFSQISPNSKIFNRTNSNNCSIYAYKLPYRGDNYKFYGTISYHLLGRAYVNNKVHNSIIESFKISEENCDSANFKILKCTKRNFGYLRPNTNGKNGFSVTFVCPTKIKNKPTKFYYRTSINKYIENYDKIGNSKYRKNKTIDFDNMAQYIINLDNTTKTYNLKIKKIVFDKRLVKQLYKSKKGKELKAKNIYFAKFLSKKTNNKYNDLFYVEFEVLK